MMVIPAVTSRAFLEREEGATNIVINLTSLLKSLFPIQLSPDLYFGVKNYSNYMTEK